MNTTEALQVVKQAEQMPSATEEYTFWRILGILGHSLAFSPILVHPNRPAALFCIIVHSGASWCILMHSGAFFCILVHSGAFCCSLVHSGAFWYILLHLRAFRCILLHLRAFWFILVDSRAFSCILLHSHAFLHILLSPSPSPQPVRCDRQNKALATIATHFQHTDCSQSSIYQANMDK